MACAVRNVLTDHTTKNDDARWKPPPIGMWKLNCDGSIKNNELRWNLIFAFSHRLDACTFLEAELWGDLSRFEFGVGKGLQTDDN